MRGLDGTQTTAVGEDVTRPYYLVYLGFETPVRLSSLSAISWDGFGWASADMDVSLGNSPSLRIYNETTLLGQVVLTDGTRGRSVKVYQGYVNDSAHPNPVLMFSGEMGTADIAEVVTIRLKQSAPLKTPRHYAVPPLVNHVPPHGTRFETPKQVIILERE